MIKIRNEVFGFDVYLVYSSVDDFIKLLDSEDVEYNDISDNCDGLVLYKGATEAFLYLSDISDYVLLHECIHIIQGILARKGIDTSYDNTEVLAYNVDWLYRKLLYNYFKEKKDKRYKDYE